MDTKRIILTLGVLSIAGSFCGYLMLQSGLQPSTYADLLVRLGKASVYGFGALALIFFVLLLTPKAFGAWKKFAIWFVPLAALLFAVYPYPGPADFFSPYPEQIYQWVSGLYVVICLGIVAVHVLRPK